MQKCPKCGTILDDSKKQCYMCGTMLKQDTAHSMAEALGMTNEDQQSSAPHSYASDFSENEKVNLFYSEDMNKLNSLEYDNRSTFEKNFNSIFNDNDQLASKADNTQMNMPQQMNNQTPDQMEQPSFSFPQEFNIEEQPVIEKNKKNKKKKQKQDSFFEEEQEQPEQIQENSFYGQDDDSEYQEVVQMQPKQKKERNNKNDYKYVSLEEEATKKVSPPLIRPSTIFNTVCVIIFVIILITAVNKLNSNPKDKTTKLGELKYEVNKAFELASTDSTSRYYKYGETCSIKLVYGHTSEGDDFVDNYLSSMKAEFEGQQNTESLNEEIMINDNKWKALSIINFVQIGNTTEYEHFIKYKYVSIFHNGSFFHTTFVNTNNNSECRQMYEDFTNSLRFD